jgi:hypothetical protein
MKKQEQQSSAQGAAEGTVQPVDKIAIITTDEHAGVGGSFVLDPATGQRARVEFTKNADDAAATEKTEKE